MWPFHAAVDHLKVRHDELQINRFDVAEGIDGNVCIGVGHDVHDVFIVKAAYNVHDGVGAADILKKLVAETRALARALDKTCDVNKFDNGGGLLLGWYISASLSSRSSGTATMPTFGSMVQKG